VTMNKNKDTVKPMFIEKEPWERMQEESEQAFRAFNTYLDLPSGERTLVAIRRKYGKKASYDRQLQEWKSKYQWRSRCQAFDAAQLEKARDAAEEEKLRLYADGLYFGRFFFKNVALDLQHQFEGRPPGEPTKDTHSGEQNRTPYVKKNNFTVTEKIRLMTWGYEMAVRNASAQKRILLEKGTEELKATAFDEAFSEVLDTDPDLHDAYLRLISKALEKSSPVRKRKPRGS
jgi:hypothetical protein